MNLFLLLIFLFTAGCRHADIISDADGRPMTSRMPDSVRLLAEFQNSEPLRKPRFELHDPGSLDVLDYSLYGDIIGAGTSHYKFMVKDGQGLKKAIGAGIFPNEDGIIADPEYKDYKIDNAMDISPWDALRLDDLRLAFYVWARAREDKGVRTFYTAIILEKAGLIIPALKAYHALLVHFPGSACFAADRTFVWYPAGVAIASIQRLCRENPSLGLEFIDASFSIENGKDINLKNDVITVNPGRFIKKTLADRQSDLARLSSLKTVETRGKGKVQVARLENGHWQLRVDRQPFFVRGVTYTPTKIGLGPKSDPHYFLDRWMWSDENRNGKIDAPYDTWIDKNNNGRQDTDEVPVGDFQLMKDIGINAIRIYIPNQPGTGYAADMVNKPLLRDMHGRFGIWLIAGDFLGAYTNGSGATWAKGTDYTDARQCDAMLATLRAKVLDLRHEPFLLMWLLGNENNMPSDFMGANATRTNAGLNPEAYARFLQKAAQMVHELDPDHPVAVGNQETGSIEYYDKYAPAIDILGINSYRGTDGFADDFEYARQKFDRPVLITEYGCDAYADGKGEDQEAQALYHQGNFRDIIFNQAGGPGAGNAIGGVIFQFIDEWWKDTLGDPETRHNIKATYQFPTFPDGFSHDEWYGITSQGSGTNSPFERRLRQAYFFYKDLDHAL